MPRFGLIVLLVALVLMMGSRESTGQTPYLEEPGWCFTIIAKGEFKQQLEATPIELRPYRPFHFYGNAVRRKFYRGTYLPRAAGGV